MIATYDIETIGMDQPIAIGMFTGKEYRSYLRTSEDSDPIWDFLCDVKENFQGVRFFAHNAVNFDNKFILNSLIRHGEKVQFPVGSARIHWTEPCVDFEDSYLMLGVGLRKACKAFDLREKGVWDHKTTANVFESGKLQEFLEYLRRDCEALYEVIKSYCKTLLDNFNMLPSMTLSLTAAKIFDKCFYSLKAVDANEDFESFIRQATYGGRNEVFRRKADSFYLYDVRSMYVSCYDSDVPIGRMQWTTPNIDKPSIALAKVKVPPMHVGPLPFKLNTSIAGSRLIFPVGEFKGWWDVSELRFAASKGCDISIQKQLECDEAPILKEFGEKMWELRTLANPDMSLIWKLHGLRLAGKLGQHRFRTEISHINDIEDQEGWWPIDDSETYHERVTMCNGHRAPYTRPAVNMRIRSQARIRHGAKLFEALNKGRIYYCDNDSIYTDIPMFQGEGLGDLKLVDHAVEGWFIRQKFYGYIDDRGHLRTRTAGFHEFKLQAQDFEGMVQGDIKSLDHSFEVLTPWKSALSGRGTQLVGLRKTITAEREFESRIINGVDTEPIRLRTNKGRVEYIKPPYYSVA